MNETEARTLREAHNAYVKRISRMSRAALAELERADQADRGVVHVFGGPVTRDELIAALCELHYPAAKMNEAGHVLWHTYGATNSACELCHGTGAHTDLTCDCGRVSLHALCACQHPRHKHWRGGAKHGHCADCDCRDYSTASVTA